MWSLILAIILSWAAIVGGVMFALWLVGLWCPFRKRKINTKSTGKDPEYDELKSSPDEIERAQKMLEREVNALLREFEGFTGIFIRRIECRGKDQDVFCKLGH